MGGILSHSLSFFLKFLRSRAEDSAGFHGILGPKASRPDSARRDRRGRRCGPIPAPHANREERGHPSGCCPTRPPAHAHLAVSQSAWICFPLNSPGRGPQACMPSPWFPWALTFTGRTLVTPGAFRMCIVPPKPTQMTVTGKTKSPNPCNVPGPHRKLQVAQTERPSVTGKSTAGGGAAARRAQGVQSPGGGGLQGCPLWASGCFEEEVRAPSLARKAMRPAGRPRIWSLQLRSTLPLYPRPPAPGTGGMTRKNSKMM